MENVGKNMMIESAVKEVPADNQSLSLVWCFQLQGGNGQPNAGTVVDIDEAKLPWNANSMNWQAKI